jgi:selenocysteine-specific elongation factor
LLDADRLEPGNSGWAQLRLRDEVAVARGDRYIVRRPSPSVTIGGGVVIDAQPRRHKRFHEQTLQTLQTLQRGTPEELVLEALGSSVVELRSVVEKSGLDQAQAIDALSKLLASGQVLQLSGSASAVLGSQPTSLLMSSSAWEELMRRVETLLGHYHRQQPLRRGMSKEELKSRLAQAIPSRPFPYVMSLGVSRGMIAEDATTYRLPGHQPTYSPAQQAQVDSLRRAHASNPYSPPSPAELGTDAEVVAALVDGGELVKIDEALFYTREAYDQMRAKIVETLDGQGEINVATLRDLFGTTRKYAIPFLEHLDEQKVTRRMGDVRVRW